MIDRDVAPRQRFTVGQLRQIQQALVPPPETSAVSVLVYDLDSGRELMTKAAHLPVSPASLAKLMTALLVFEQNRLEEQVTIQQEDLVGEAAMGLSKGEELRVEELLWGLLIPSGNDAAMALARHHSGQVEAFVRHMNLRAGDLRMYRTQFLNPNGFDADGQVSSAQDLLTLVRQLWSIHSSAKLLAPLRRPWPVMNYRRRTTFSVVTQELMESRPARPFRAASR